MDQTRARIFPFSGADTNASFVFRQVFSLSREILDQPVHDRFFLHIQIQNFLGSRP
jgi:hypothetical protein